MTINDFEKTSYTIERAKFISERIIDRIVDALTNTKRPLTLKEITALINKGYTSFWETYAESTIRGYLSNMVEAKLVACEERKEETIFVKTRERADIDCAGELSKIVVTDEKGRTFVTDNPYFHNTGTVATVPVKKPIQVKRYYYSLAKGA